MDAHLLDASPDDETALHELTEGLRRTGLDDNRDDKQDEVRAHFELLQSDEADEDAEELIASPVFTAPVLEHARSLDVDPKPLTQYGLLGASIDRRFRDVNHAVSAGEDPRIFFNAVAPSSVFICGSQGSGKSHTLSCLLENCLTQNEANVLPRPLTGVVFHYDPWCSDTGGLPCEAAYLSSAEGTSVRVLCPPTNVRQIQRIYGGLPRVTVEELRINQSDLNTRRMLDLMAVSSGQGAVPLYVHVVTRILRELRIEQQLSGATFNYRAFKRALMSETSLTAAQLGPLQQRLDALESFMVHEQVMMEATKNPIKGKGRRGRGNLWTPKAGQLTIVDLSCPCVTVEMACSLFNICLSLFLEQDSSEIGRVVALDEAHKYMTDTPECQVLTEALLSNIRLQRHLAMRVIISTQEPTISPRLLDLCSVTIVHRFTSPDWLQSLKKHLAGASTFSQALGFLDDGDERAKVGGVVEMTKDDLATRLFSKIVALRRGEALMFSPSAIVGIRKPPLVPNKLKVETSSSLLIPFCPTPAASSPSSSSEDGDDHEARGRIQLVKLGHGVLHLRVRHRVTWDGGRSIMAS